MTGKGEEHTYSDGNFGSPTLLAESDTTPFLRQAVQKYFYGGVEHGAKDGIEDVVEDTENILLHCHSYHVQRNNLLNIVQACFPMRNQFQ